MFHTYLRTGGTQGKDMNPLNEDVMWYIYRTYWGVHVMKELIQTQTFLWREPSENLKNLCSKDPGCIQFGYNDLWEMIDDEFAIPLDECLHGECANCQTYGWPCANMATYGFKNEGLEGLWGFHV